MAAPIVIEQTKTLDQVPFTASQRHKIVLKSVCYGRKQIKNFFKGTGRMIDMKGRGLWFELTGNTSAELDRRAAPYKPGKVSVFENLVFKRSLWVSGGIFVDLNPSQRVRRHPVPDAHPCLAGFHLDAAEPSCRLEKCVLADGHTRADVRGLVVQTPMGAQYAPASIVPGLISLLCVATETPTVEEAEHGVTVVYKAARSVCALAASFRLEAFCRLEERPVYRMEDGAPRLVLGSVRFEDGKPVVMAERVFAVPLGENEAKAHFEAEVAGTLELLTHHVESPSGSPTAEWLIKLTPAKRRCTHEAE